MLGRSREVVFEQHHWWRNITSRHHKDRFTGHTAPPPHSKSLKITTSLWLPPNFPGIYIDLLSSRQIRCFQGQRPGDHPIPSVACDQVRPAAGPLPFGHVHHISSLGGIETGASFPLGDGHWRVHKCLYKLILHRIIKDTLFVSRSFQNIAEYRWCLMVFDLRQDWEKFHRETMSISILRWSAFVGMVGLVGLWWSHVAPLNNSFQTVVLWPQSLQLHCWMWQHLGSESPLLPCSPRMRTRAPNLVQIRSLPKLVHPSTLSIWSICCDMLQVEAGKQDLFKKCFKHVQNSECSRWSLIW